jgi:hypothetical protein
LELVKPVAFAEMPDQVEKVQAEPVGLYLYAVVPVPALTFSNPLSPIVGAVGICVS